MLIITGQSKAKRRVFAFLTVFVMTGALSEFGSSIASRYPCVDGTNYDVTKIAGHSHLENVKFFHRFSKACRIQYNCWQNSIILSSFAALLSYRLYLVVHVLDSGVNCTSWRARHFSSLINNSNCI